jgi:hypothetical protein
MHTAQPWQVFAWAAVRYGENYISITSVKLVHEGTSIHVRTKALNWRQKRNKDESIDLVASHLRRGEWAPLLTMWLGDGNAKRKDILSGDYKLVIVAKEPWRLSNSVSAKEALVARGKEAFVKLREAAGVCGELLDLLKAHKWVIIKLATDDVFRLAYKLKTKKRSIDILREVFGQNDVEASAEQLGLERNSRQGSNVILVAGVVMYLRLVSSRGGSLFAEYFTRDVGKALAVADKLKAAGFRPNVVRSGPKYVVYIAMADLLRLAEKDGEIRRAIALYLAEKAKNGTPRQREIAEKLLKRHPLFPIS